MWITFGIGKNDVRENSPETSRDACWRVTYPQSRYFFNKCHCLFSFCAYNKEYSKCCRLLMARGINYSVRQMFPLTDGAEYKLFGAKIYPHPPWWGFLSYWVNAAVRMLIADNLNYNIRLHKRGISLFYTDIDRIYNLMVEKLETAN